MNQSMPSVTSCTSEILVVTREKVRLSRVRSPEKRGYFRKVFTTTACFLLDINSFDPACLLFLSILVDECKYLEYN